MIPKIEDNEVIYYFGQLKSNGVALSFTRTYIDEKFYVIDCPDDKEVGISIVYNKLLNTILDIITVVNSEDVTILTIPNLTRATVLVYSQGLSDDEKRGLLIGAIGFILAYAKSNYNMAQALSLHKNNHIVCDEEVIVFGEKYQEYYSINNSDDMVVFGSNVITAFTMRIECDTKNINPSLDRAAFQECISNMKFTKCDAPLEVRYGDTGYGIRVDLKQVRGDLSTDLEYKVGQLYNAMLSLIIAINTKE